VRAVLSDGDYSDLLDADLSDLLDADLSDLLDADYSDLSDADYSDPLDADPSNRLFSLDKWRLSVARWLRPRCGGDGTKRGPLPGKTII